MNLKGICLYFGYGLKIGVAERLIKESGFDTIITCRDENFNYQNGPLSKQVKLCKKNGLKLSSLHMKYYGMPLEDFWKEGKSGDDIELSLKKDIKLAHKYGFSCVVVHTVGEMSQVGLDRFARLLALCEKLDVPMALENIGNYKLLTDIFGTIKSDYLKFCFDIGHQNVFDKDKDALAAFGDKLICLHLHSNMGEEDEHTLNKYGNIDWDAFAKRLAQLNPNIVLDYEILMHTRHCEKPEEVLSEVYKQACELEEKIAKYAQK